VTLLFTYSLSLSLSFFHSILLSFSPFQLFFNYSHFFSSFIVVAVTWHILYWEQVHQDGIIKGSFENKNKKSLSIMLKVDYHANCWSKSVTFQTLCIIIIVLWSVISIKLAQCHWIHWSVLVSFYLSSFFWLSRGNLKDVHFRVEQFFFFDRAYLCKHLNSLGQHDNLPLIKVSLKVARQKKWWVSYFRIGQNELIPASVK